MREHTFCKNVRQLGYALANISADGETLLSWFCSWLDPAARLIGLDGVILAAFILGLPANELVIPIMLMAYTSGSCLTEISSYAALSEVLSGNGWTAMTAVSAVQIGRASCRERV